MRGVLSDTLSAMRARERRLTLRIAKEEKLMDAKVGALMRSGMTFDEAWIAAGGEIIPLVVENAHGAAVREILATTGDYLAGCEENLRRSLSGKNHLHDFIIEDAT